MSAKQDRQGARTVADLERKHKFGASFAKAMGIADDAREAAENAQKTADNPSAKLTHEEIFNLLTKNDTLQGIYRGDDGDIYINASYLKSGIIDANLIKTGVLQSADGAIQLDLNTGALAGISPDGNLLFDLRRNSANTGAVLRLMSNDQTKEIVLDISDTMATIGFSYNGRTDINISYMPEYGDSQLVIGNVSADLLTAKQFGVRNGTTVSIKNISWQNNGDGTYTLIGR